ncbi:C-terminal binding protein [Cohnella nanjingensis]|uniref:C-terminal binding protein n=1 Tax=Cohnella nanjingensis TaxID=1387779 RepID=A0A7X0VE99_9BACL|nr:C-terminal binding protein [Cohnella nanjingensis]MBB6670780.1 C-terminal binding protein [Cohnella nanjingensis]
MTYRIAYVNVGFLDTLIEDRIAAEAGMRIDYFNGMDTKELPQQVKDADAVIVTLEKFTDDLMSRIPNLKVIGRMGVGTDSLDIEAATRRGIPIINIPDYCIEEVALQAVSLMLAAHRKVVPANKLVSERRWGMDGIRPIHALSGLTLGLLGMGRIGVKVIEYMRAMVGAIAVYDPYLTPDKAPPGVKLVSLEELLSESDMISVHCPLSPETRYLINRENIAKMEKKPIVVNVSRGPIIHEEDLLEGLNSGQVRYAALDVLEQEPPEPSHPLLDHPNALITSHIAWYSEEAQVRMRELSIRRVIDYLEGRSVPTIVNPQAVGAR